MFLLTVLTDFFQLKVHLLAQTSRLSRNLAFLIDELCHLRQDPQVFYLSHLTHLSI